MNRLFITLLTPLLFGASCASDSPAEKDQSTTPAPSKGFEKYSSGNYSFTQDSEGKLVKGNDKRSQFEAQGEARLGKKQFKTSEYKTGDYKKTTWAGNKSYATQDYAGNTDGSRFKTRSGLNDKSAREANTNAKIPSPYQTNTYATNSAREGTGKPYAKPMFDQTGKGRVDDIQAKILGGWQEQRSMSMDQSKSIFGR